MNKLTQQVNRLAAYLMENGIVPQCDEDAPRGRGACDAAVAVMQQQAERIAKLETAFADAFDIDCGYMPGDPEYDFWHECYEKVYPNK